MFKKLKDRIGEEFKQSPLRLPASVQQIAQAISPSSSSSTPTNEPKTGDGTATLPDSLSVSSDFFSISDEQDDSVGGSALHPVDLTSDSPSVLPSRSRRDSLSSIASDVSSMYPLYETPLNHSTLQSDFESELDESTHGQLERISKEHLYRGYKKLLYRYNKYKGRFMDLSRVHKDLQYDNIKMKNVLQESQDKALRRMAELREQCQLEQKAKAHLEESLRNDMEERDHIIATLNTKIGLLKAAVRDNTGLTDSMLVDVEDTPNVASRLQEKNAELIVEVERLKAQLNASIPAVTAVEPGHSPGQEQVKETITQLKSGIGRLKSENENISNLLSKSPPNEDANKSYEGSLIDLGSEAKKTLDFSDDRKVEADEKDKKIEKLNALLIKCKEKISSLTLDLKKKDGDLTALGDQVQRMERQESESAASISKLKEEVNAMKRREEEEMLTMAENKMTMHQELEAKEKIIENLTAALEESKAIEKELKSTAESKLGHYEQEILKLKESVSKATLVKDDIMLKLKQQLDQPQLTSPNDAEFLLTQKQALQQSLNVFMDGHEKKLTEALTSVESKMAAAEGNIMRQCADKLIELNARHVELRQQSILADARCNEASTRLNELSQQLKSVEAKLQDKQRELGEKDAAVNKLTADVNEKINRLCVVGAELQDAKDRLEKVDDMEGTIDQLMEAKSDVEQSLAKLQKQMAEDAIKMDRVLQDNVTHKTTILELEKVKQDLEKAGAELEKGLRESQSKVSKCERDTQELREHKSGVEKKVQELLAEREEYLTERRQGEEMRENLQKECSNYQEQLKKLMEDRTESQKKIDELTAEKLANEKNLAQYVGEIAGLTRKLEFAEEKNSSFNESCDRSKDLELELTGMSCELEKLKAELESVSSGKTVLGKRLEEVTLNLQSEEENGKHQQQTITAMESTLQNATVALESEKNAIAVLKAEISSLRSLIEEKESLLDSTQVNVASYQSQLSQLEETNVRLKQEVEAKEDIISKLTEEQEKLRNELTAALSERESSSEELSSKLKQAQSQGAELTEQLVEKCRLLSDLENQLAHFRYVDGELQKYKDGLLAKEVEVIEKSEMVQVLELKTSELNERLQVLQRDFAEERTSLTQRIADLEDNVRIASEEKVEAQQRLEEEMTKFKAKAEASNSELTEQLLELESSKQVLASDNRAKDETIVQYRVNLERLELSVKETVDKLAAANEALSDKQGSLDKLRIDLQNVNTQKEELSCEVQSLKSLLEELETRNKSVSDDVDDRVKMERESSENKMEALVNELNSARSEVAEERAQHEANLAKLREESESRMSILKNEIKFLNEKFGSEVQSIEVNREKEINEVKEKLNHSEKMAAELVKKLEVVAADKEELTSACAEKTMKLAELEACLKDLKSDLDRNFNDTSKMSASQFEEMYEEKLKNIVAEYEAQISERDSRLQENEVLLSEHAESQDALRELRQELKTLRKEQYAIDELFESKTEELESLKKEFENRLINVQIENGDAVEAERLKLAESLQKQADDFNEKLVAEKSNLEEQLNAERRTSQSLLEAKEAEWFKEKQNPEDFEPVPLEEIFASESTADLESTSKLAVAAMGSSTSSIDILRQQLMQQSEQIAQLKKQHKREIVELSKLAAWRGSRIDEGGDVEHEYLRNILYEYMMGREQTTLAKVLAAIVKFDSKQMQNILDRQSSMNSLRIL